MSSFKRLRSWLKRSHKPKRPNDPPTSRSSETQQPTRTPTPTPSAQYPRSQSRPDLATHQPTQTSASNIHVESLRPQSSPNLVVDQLTRTPIPDLNPPGVKTMSTSHSAGQTALNVIKLALKTISLASDNIPVPGIKLVTESLLATIDKVQQTSDNKSGLLDLANRMERLQPVFSCMQDVKGNSAVSVPLFESLKIELEGLNFGIESAISNGTLSKFFNSADDASSLAKHTAKLDSLIGELTLSISMDINQKIQSLAEANITKEQRELFNTLNRVDSAAYNSAAREYATGCLNGTRIDVLKSIHDWVEDSDNLLFWLNGVAGAGKSSIAHSIALHYDIQTPRRLGASFFFSRDQKERREARFLFQTIAFQLGNTYPALKVEIAKALEDQTILTSNSQRQLQKLILEPVTSLHDCFVSSIIIVVDALDECEEYDGVSRMIKLLVAELENHRLPLKFLVTSRPEMHLRSTFHSPRVGSNTYPFILHDVEPSDVGEDIKIFINHELKLIAEDSPMMVKDLPWPSDSESSALIKISAGLFIAAATAVRFIKPIRGSYDPQVRLKTLLDAHENGRFMNSHPFEYLDVMYTQILDMAFAGSLPSDTFANFRTIVGTIVLAYGRLTVAELAELLQMQGKVGNILADLHSVIQVPDGDGLVHARHLSFPDYLTNELRCTNKRFFINPPLHHAEIARFCVENMMRLLRRDICDIQDRTKMNSDIDPKKIKERIPGDLQYACRYWALHLSECSIDESLVSLVDSFVSKYILYWIEALSLIGELGGGIKSLQLVLAKLSSVWNLPDDLAELVRDAERFLFNFYDIINGSALHIYYSALPFTPKDTSLYQLFAPDLKDIPKVIGGVNSKWDACLRTLVGHSNDVQSVAISHDGTRIISGSFDKTIRIWDAHNGVPLHELKGHSSAVSSVAISHDGTRIISGSDDHTIRIWDAHNGAPLYELKGHSDLVRSVAISHDGTRIISGSDDNTIRIWDAHNGAPLHELKGHSDWVRSVAMSHDGTRIISGSGDNTIRIWDSQNGVPLHELKGHSNAVLSVAISHDGTRIISGSDDKTIRIWDAHNGVPLHELKGHSDLVRSVAISHDGTRIISGSDDETIRIWDAHNGVRLHELQGHSNRVRSVAISHDGTRIISGSDDKTIWIWDALNEAPLHRFDTPHRIWEVQFSPDERSILTDEGTFTIPPHALPLSPPQLLSHEPIYAIQNEWVLDDDKKICWIPPPYRGSTHTSSASLLAIVTEGGNVVILRFPQYI